MIDKTLCTGCLNCLLACMQEHGDSVVSFYHLDLGDRNNEGRCRISMDQNNHPTPIFCRHCDEPECVTACMSGAMVKDSVKGLVTYDEKKCAACFMCVMSCPYGAVMQSAKSVSKVVKCDFCFNRENPRCVESCPTGAIRVEEVKKA